MFLYKYRSGTPRDIEALMNNQFYASSMEKLNDIHEGKIIIDNQEIEFFDLFVKNNASTFNISMKEEIKNFINIYKNSGVYSLSKNYNNELLWAYYSDSHKGFCIEYDFDILKQYPCNEDAFLDVKYSKNVPIMNLGNILDSSFKKSLVTKSLSWKHEEEIRILTPSSGMFTYFNRAVKSIYFGYRTSENTIKLIMNILRGRGIKYYKMEHKKDLYELERTEIEDIFKKESIYRNKMNEFFPSYIDEKVKPYVDLLKKAIIIVENEPLCEEIIDADMSSTRGTKDNPVFFIGYKNEKMNIFARNYFISKKEIEEIFNFE
ncbi:DUF2971 domain-containing protein [Aliarcobacter butzleri]|uniref:DUF2971 domain-containing protein n=1 Tax=Aliarcobacter butzleri TaxID=28197 RepID=UPI00125F0E99|nr:DUF2971 domain-containing protein [Aliarcobacter butzleri]